MYPITYFDSGSIFGPKVGFRGIGSKNGTQIKGCKIKFYVKNDTPYVYLTSFFDSGFIFGPKTADFWPLCSLLQLIKNKGAKSYVMSDFNRGQSSSTLS